MHGERGRLARFRRRPADGFMNDSSVTPHSPNFRSLHHMPKPKLTRNRILLAYAIAVIADLLEFPIAAAEATVLGAPVGGFAAFVLDCAVMGAMTMLLGFHWMFLPTFGLEAIPGLDLLPTWVGCVAFVVWQRKKVDI